LRSLSELLASTTTSSSIDSEEDGGGWAGADFSRLDDPRALHQFLDSCNYLLKSLNPGDESYYPSRECFVCDRELRKGASAENKGEHTSVDVVTCITTRAGGAAMPPLVGQSQPQLEQLWELERKLEERQQLAHLRVALERELRSRNDGDAA
jgi:hypothetical protein